MAASKIDATPGQLNLTLYQGDDFWMTVTVTDFNNNPVSLAGCTVKASIKAPDSSWTAQITTTIASNTVTLHLTHTASLTMTGTSANWDCQLTDASGYVTTLMFGQVTITGEITT